MQNPSVAICWGAMWDSVYLNLFWFMVSLEQNHWLSHRNSRGLSLLWPIYNRPGVPASASTSQSACASAPMKMPRLWHLIKHRTRSRLLLLATWWLSLNPTHPEGTWEAGLGLQRWGQSQGRSVTLRLFFFFLLPASLSARRLLTFIWQLTVFWRGVYLCTFWQELEHVFRKHMVGAGRLLVASELN